MRFAFFALLTATIALTAACAASDATDDDGESAEAQTRGGQTELAPTFPSPSIVRDGSVYHAYIAKRVADGTPLNIPHFIGDADGHWKYAGDALPKLNEKARSNGTNYVVWAPAVAKLDATHWVLHYSATLASSTGFKKCLFRATASSADGPFVDDNDGELYCAPATLWAIDPYLVQDGAGAYWLGARIDEPGGINTIKVRKLDATATNFARGTEWTTLTQNTATSWEQPVLENAAIVNLAPAKAQPHWFVFYSGAAWSDNSYAIGYADCGASITGPCEKKTVKGPWMATDAKEGVYGPGTPTFYENAKGETLMSIQAWKFDGGKANGLNSRGQVMRTYAMSLKRKGEPQADFVRMDE